MPPRRYGSARRNLEYLELLALTITGDWRVFGDQTAAEAAYWQHRDRVLSFGNQQAGHRPEAFWWFEAKWIPPPDPDRRSLDDDNDLVAAARLVELAKLRWLRDHDQLQAWERAELLAWAARSSNGSWWRYRPAEIVELLGS
jgi:hypothetical protein